MHEDFGENVSRTYGRNEIFGQSISCFYCQKKKEEMCQHLWLDEENGTLHTILTVHVGNWRHH